MHAGHGPRLAFHHLEMHQDFARALFFAAKLVALEIHQAHVLRRHETLAYQRRGAEREVFPRRGWRCCRHCRPHRRAARAAGRCRKSGALGPGNRTIRKNFEFGFRISGTGRPGRGLRLFRRRDSSGWVSGSCSKKFRSALNSTTAMPGLIYRQNPPISITIMSV